jgi:hypothetical protein
MNYWKINNEIKKSLLFLKNINNNSTTYLLNTNNTELDRIEYFISTIATFHLKILGLDIHSCFIEFEWKNTYKEDEYKKSNSICSTITYLTDSNIPTLIIDENNIHKTLKYIFPKENMHVSMHANSIYGITNILNIQNTHDNQTTIYINILKEKPFNVPYYNNTKIINECIHNQSHNDKLKYEIVNILKQKYSINDIENENIFTPLTISNIQHVSSLKPNNCILDDHVNVVKTELYNENMFQKFINKNITIKEKYYPIQIVNILKNNYLYQRRFESSVQRGDIFNSVNNYSIIEIEFNNKINNIFSFLNERYGEEIKDILNLSLGNINITNTNKFIEKKIIKKLLTSDICKIIIEECESYAELHKGWLINTELNRHEIFIKSNTNISKMITNLVDMVIFSIKKTYNIRYNFNIIFDELLIVKYNEIDEIQKITNTDKSMLTMNILLSNINDYNGGDIFFENINDKIELNEGDMLLYYGKLQKTTYNVNKGIKYNLIGLIQFNIDDIDLISI